MDAKKDTRSKKEREAEVDAELHHATKKLLEQMEEALAQDYAAIENGLPALARVKLSPTLEHLLKKKIVQHYFLQSQGLNALARWIIVNPDGSSPLVQVVELAFSILESLKIDASHLEESNIASIVKQYSVGDSDHRHLINRASQLI